jgi:hypothetical protein
VDRQIETHSRAPRELRDVAAVWKLAFPSFATGISYSIPTRSYPQPRERTVHLGRIGVPIGWVQRKRLADRATDC